MPTRHFITYLLLLLLGVAALPSWADDVLQGQGHAAVVSADGYLLCASAFLPGAGNITATIAGKVYPATIVKIDEAHHLALLKVEAANLPALSIDNLGNITRGGNGFIAGYAPAPFRGANLLSVPTRYSLGNAPQQPTAILVNNRPWGESDGFFLLSAAGEIVGMMRHGFGVYPQYYLTPLMPAKMRRARCSPAPASHPRHSRSVISSKHSRPSRC